MQSIHIRRVLIGLVLVCTTVLPALQAVPSVNAQGNFVQPIFIYITLSNRQGSPSDDAFTFEFYGPEGGRPQAMVRTRTGHFGGDSGQTTVIHIPNQPVEKSALRDPSNICLVAGGTDGLLIDTLFIIGFDGQQWGVYGVWFNSDQLWLDRDLNESPWNRAELDLAGGNCRHR